MRARNADRTKGPPLLRHSKLYNALAWRLAGLFERRPEKKEVEQVEVPTHLTLEDPLTIEVLLEDDSAEWLWLKSMFSELRDAVEEDRATLIITVFPLAYQLDENYPYLPQVKIAEYCRENSVLCFDLLKPFRQHAPEDLFTLDEAKFHDIWHLTEYGHVLSASEIARFLEEHGLL